MAGYRSFKIAQTYEFEEGECKKGNVVPPGNPCNLKTLEKAEVIKLSWTIPEENSRVVGGYRVEMKKEHNGSWKDIGSTGKTSVIVHGLVPSTEYYFRVQAYNRNAPTVQSRYSDEHKAETKRSAIARAGVTALAGVGGFLAGTLGPVFGIASTIGAAVDKDSGKNLDRDESDGVTVTVGTAFSLIPVVGGLGGGPAAATLARTRLAEDEFGEHEEDSDRLCGF